MTHTPNPTARELLDRIKTGEPLSVSNKERLRIWIEELLAKERAEVERQRGLNRDLIGAKMQSLERRDKIENLKAEITRLNEREKAWQAMCEKSVGSSMLADEFADEPHEPENFGAYIKNMEEQITRLNGEVAQMTADRDDLINEKHSILDDVAHLSHRLEQARGALKPFADRIRALDGGLWPMELEQQLTWCRQAKATLTPTPEAGLL